MAFIFLLLQVNPHKTLENVHTKNVMLITLLINWDGLNVKHGSDDSDLGVEEMKFGLGWNFTSPSDSRN